MTRENLKEVLNKHAQWLAKKEEGETADLSGEDLRDVDLSYTNLFMANFC